MEYGDPKRGDPTSRLDSIVNEATIKFQRVLGKLVPAVMNRPHGSKVLSSPEKVEEYKLVYKGNPQAHAERLAQFQADDGALEGLKKYTEWVLSMEKKVSE